MMVCMYVYFSQSSHPTMLMQMHTQPGSIRGIEKEYRVTCPKQAERILIRNTGNEALHHQYRGILYQNHVRFFLSVFIYACMSTTVRHGSWPWVGICTSAQPQGHVTHQWCTTSEEQRPQKRMTPMQTLPDQMMILRLLLSCTLYVYMHTHNETVAWDGTVIYICTHIYISTEAQSPSKFCNRS